MDTKTKLMVIESYLKIERFLDRLLKAGVAPEDEHTPVTEFACSIFDINMERKDIDDVCNVFMDKVKDNTLPLDEAAFEVFYEWREFSQKPDASTI